jgi:hypothetical protein
MLIAVPENRPMERWKLPSRVGRVALECIFALSRWLLASKSDPFALSVGPKG